MNKATVKEYKGELSSGEIVTLQKDCDCVIHDGPHWLHMDAVSRQLNQPHLDRAVEADRMQGILAIRAFAQAESIRLKEKQNQMESKGIARIIKSYES